MTSKYHYIRNSKQAQDDEAVKSIGPRTWGYDYANDGHRSIIDYKVCHKWVESQVGKRWDDIYSAAHKKWNNDTYIGKETIDYVYYLIECSRWSNYYLEDGILKRRVRKKYKRQKPKPSYVKYSGCYYYKVDDIWYEVLFKVPRNYKFIVNEFTGEKKYYYYINDIFCGTISGNEAEVRRVLNPHYGDFIYAASKQQVGKRLCRKLNQLIV